MPVNHFSEFDLSTLEIITDVENIERGQSIRENVKMLKKSALKIIYNIENYFFMLIDPL